MSKYKMIAFDMDGTLLNSQKKVRKETLDAINKAFDAGKEVILCTGRALAELEEYRINSKNEIYGYDKWSICL